MRRSPRCSGSPSRTRGRVSRAVCVRSPWRCARQRKRPRDAPRRLACLGGNPPRRSFEGTIVSAIEELRENLREAARRDVRATRVRRRRQRRATGLIAVALISGAAAAGAADLIAVGEPAVDARGVQPDRYKPPPGSLRPAIVARADADDELPIGLGVYP